MNSKQIQDLRFRVLKGEDVSVEEMTAALTAQRESRASASTASAAKTAKAKKPSNIPDNLDDLFS